MSLQSTILERDCRPDADLRSSSRRQEKLPITWLTAAHPIIKGIDLPGTDEDQSSVDPCYLKLAAERNTTSRRKFPKPRHCGGGRGFSKRHYAEVNVGTISTAGILGTSEALAMEVLLGAETVGKPLHLGHLVN